MINLKIITNRSLCNNSLNENLKNVFLSWKETEFSDFSIESIVLREKDLDDFEYLSLFKDIKNLTDSFDIPLYSHTHWNANQFISNKNIHLTMRDFTSIFENKTKKHIFLSNYNNIGVSTHSIEEVLYAESVGASYVIFGHIFNTNCKPNLEPKGLKILRKICKSTNIPVYAIGGINKNNLKSVLDCGASGVCLMSSIMNLGNI